MAVSKCGSCNGTQFETKVASPAGTSHEIAFVQCASCGAAVGIVPFFDADSPVRGVHEELKRLVLSIAEIERQVARLIRASGR
jgi:hypothetical protein